MYCKQHADSGMVNVNSERCAHDPCMRRPYYNFVGAKEPVYCKQHAEESMVNVKKKLCAHDPCMRYPYYNFEVITTPVYCRQHSEKGMVDVHNKRCSYDSCTKYSSFITEGIKNRRTAKCMLRTAWLTSAQGNLQVAPAPQSQHKMFQPTSWLPHGAGVRAIVWIVR